MSRTVSQIMKELDKSGGYASDRAILQTQLKALPGQAKAEIGGLDAKLGQANTKILEGARGRGLGFSGIPIAEQAQYAATEYAPAIARVKQSQNEQKLGILGSLNGLSRDQRTQAQSMFENNRNFTFQQAQAREARRQFDEQMRLNRENAARSAASAASGPSAGEYISALMQNQQQTTKQAAGPSKADQVLYSRAKSLQTIYDMDRPQYDRLVARLSKGNKADRQVIQTVKQLIGGGGRGGAGTATGGGGW